MNVFKKILIVLPYTNFFNVVYFYEYVIKFIYSQPLCLSFSKRVVLCSLFLSEILNYNNPGSIA